MKILYGAGNFIGSNIMASRFVQNSPSHDIRIAAYYRNHTYLHSINWCLDSLYHCIRVGERNYFEQKHGYPGPFVNHALADLIIEDLLSWKPELVISDCEFFTATVAKVLEIPLWYCSPMLQLIGMEREYKELNTKIFNKTKIYLKSLPKANEYFIYSSLCDISSRPILKKGFEWIRPYSISPDSNLLSTEKDSCLPIILKAIPDKAILSTGETSFVSDCIYSGKTVFISPNQTEPEQLLNAQLLQWYGVAKNIGRSNNIDFVKRQVEEYKNLPILSIQKWKQLDEKLEMVRK